MRDLEIGVLLNYELIAGFARCYVSEVLTGKFKGSVACLEGFSNGTSTA